ncbi:MAG TPA: ATP-dependent protease subunit HslV [bacterium]|nr:ATP-dependent protease subunit HslV [bacterium]HPR88176.1 ATP-dependent protease subunit HslV [bacterium]
MSYLKSTHATTIIGLRHRGAAVLAGDGQVTYGDMVLKTRARKVRKLFHDEVLAGFAGGAADAFTLFERFEAKLEEFNGNLPRSVVELAKDWRMDRYLRRLDAQLVVLNRDKIFLLSGTGDLIEPDDSVIAIGSGGPFALAAARALIAHTQLSAEEIVKESMKIAAGICIFTNDKLTLESLE